MTTTGSQAAAFKISFNICCKDFVFTLPVIPPNNLAFQNQSNDMAFDCERDLVNKESMLPDGGTSKSNSIIQKQTK